MQEGADFLAVLMGVATPEPQQCFRAALTSAGKKILKKFESSHLWKHGQAGWDSEQPDLVEGVPAHCR